MKEKIKTLFERMEAEDLCKGLVKKISDQHPNGIMFPIQELLEKLAIWYEEDFSEREIDLQLIFYGDPEWINIEKKSDNIRQRIKEEMQNMVSKYNTNIKNC